MATRRMLQDTATVFIPTGEVEDEMQFEVYFLRHVFCRSSTGSKRSRSGFTPNETLDLYIFDGLSEMTDSAGRCIDTASKCEEIFGVIRNDLHADSWSERNYVVPYLATDLTKPPAMSRRINQIIRRKAGSHRMWHWEVHAS